MGELVDATVSEGAETRIHLRVPFSRPRQARGTVREVRVEGLPADAGLFLRLHRTGSWQFWRTAVSDGRAVFAHAQLGSWTLVLEDGDTETATSQPFDLQAGGGPFEFRWTR